MSALTDRLNAYAHHGTKRKKGDVPYDVIVPRDLLKEAADAIEALEAERDDAIGVLRLYEDTH